MGGEPTCVPYERGTIPTWAGNCVYEVFIAGAHGGAPLQLNDGEEEEMFRVNPCNPRLQVERHITHHTLRITH